MFIINDLALVLFVVYDTRNVYPYASGIFRATG